MRAAVLLIPPVALAAAVMFLGCQTERVIYRKIPRFYAEAGNHTGEMVLEDGTRVVTEVRDVNPKRTLTGAKTDWNEAVDGSVTLHAMIPEQVISHILRCLIEEKYEVMWEQLLAEQTRRDYERQGMGEEDFVKFMQLHRNDLYPMLNRMSMMMHTPEVIIKRAGTDIRCEFHRSVASAMRNDFGFSKVDIVQEGYDLKLLLIH